MQRSMFLREDEILPMHLYERVRPLYVQAIVEHKRRRRVALGPTVTLLFESRETVLFQIHEVLRAEAPSTRVRIEAEVGEYGPLIPRAGEITATLMIDAGSAEHGRALSHDLRTRPRTVLLRMAGRSVAGTPISTSADASCPVHYMR